MAYWQRQEIDKILYQFFCFIPLYYSPKGSFASYTSEQAENESGSTHDACRMKTRAALSPDNCTQGQTAETRSSQISGKNE
jgi:hypothetical protein